MSKYCCPYNASITCDAAYRFNEFSRQLNMAHQSGKISTFYSDDTCCGCEPRNCARYRDALPKMVQKIKEKCK